ncbi:Putative galacturan 1,4-alpha-galacturonidase A [Fulvia fulva]|uniref:galacturonan 1,4-alpha-galacturonidase n=1 Tax=Passalora fulva TaxID=5499 RepID=A0A9Q8UT61_PASFU|nr:Putative galacturan 1,4-alpha-galacturonidase A [Fulvia fulva]UJO21503.1 Putative galacturan 1,4-alpha-galacturonidase A [Fulvia fulva]
MHMKLQNARLEVFGTLSFEPDLLYWIQNSFRIEFQNQSTSWIVEGHDIEIDEGGWAQGGVNGNGQAWMTRTQGRSNQFGRPIPLTIFNSTNVSVKNFSIRQPQFWTFYAQDVQHLEMSGIFINGTNTDPAGNRSNYETNIDGFNGVRVNHARLADWYFHGGDDCIALKGNSTNFAISNITCLGGGIAFGSIGQYKESPDFVSNVTAQDISVAKDIRPPTGGAGVSGGAYFKSWVGVEAGQPPQGGGGGTGRVDNITFTGLSVQNVTNAIFVNKCYFKVPSQAQHCDTSTLVFGDLTFSNVSGTVKGSTGVSLNCSAAAPCQDIKLEDVRLASVANKSVALTCVNAKGLMVQPVTARCPP